MELSTLYLILAISGAFLACSFALAVLIHAIKQRPDPDYRVLHLASEQRTDELVGALTEQTRLLGEVLEHMRLWGMPSQDAGWEQGTSDHATSNLARAA